MILADFHSGLPDAENGCFALPKICWRTTEERRYLHKQLSRLRCER
jgi:hypothetical protein